MGGPLLNNFFQVCFQLSLAAAATARSLQSWLTLCNPHRRQPTRLPHPWDSPGKNTGVGCHFLLQWVKVKLLSRVRLFAIPWTAAYQAPPSMGFSRQEHCSGMPLPSPLTYLGRPNIKLYSLSKCEVIISQGSKRIYRKRRRTGQRRLFQIGWFLRTTS